MIVPLLLVCILFLPPVFAESDFEIKTIAENMQIPWSIDFASDGRIFFTERGGTIRVIEDGKLISEPVKKLNVGFVEGGLLGIALDPNFEDNHHIYVYYTYTDFLSTYNKVVRFTETDNTLANEFVLIDKIPGGPIHDGGRIKFAQDKTLYITTGDAGNPSLAQDLDSLAGKILRINSDGSIPKDNPFEDSPVFSLGHRNPQGLDWHSDTKNLVISEHGPSGEQGFAHDEINVIYAGRNYGWPKIVGDQIKENMENPLLHSGTYTWAPSGAAFYDSDKIPEFSGKFLVATLAAKHIMAISMDLENNEIKDTKQYFLGDYGRLRDVAVDDHGNIYILTSNRDGRGNPTLNDDRILKLSPSQDADKDILIDPSIKKQLESISNEVKCNPGLSLIFKDIVLSPACVKPESIQELIDRGWAVDYIPKAYSE